MHIILHISIFFRLFIYKNLTKCKKSHEMKDDLAKGNEFKRPHKNHPHPHKMKTATKCEVYEEMNINADLTF